ncbi:MAG: hypothetical protein LWW98_04440 [Deltaproteobacteria bacterium]|nr:hypothetical protein [Deltaproteobacteria bacterium]
MTLLIKKVACALIVLMVVQVGMDTTVFGKVSSSPVIPEKTRQRRHPVKGLLNFNFYQSDIRKILSAFAIKHKINIVMAQGVSGKISVHLHQVTQDKALDAITLAGGFSYRKHDDVYYIYKPKKAVDPQAENLQLRIFKLKYAEIDSVQKILEAIPGMRMIKIHEPTKTVIVEDIPENIKKIETIISFWDTAPKQVLIEARILEVTLTEDMSMGVNWGQILGDVRIGTGGFSSATAATARGVSPVSAAGAGIFANIITAAGSRHQFAAAIDALQAKTRINTLSTPKILAIHNEEASVQVGGEQGYKVSKVIDGIIYNSIEFIDTGTILKITPYINDDGNILLKVQPSITGARLEEDGIPVVNTTTVSTWLLAKNGETVFIGGLIQDAKTKTNDSIPCLGSIPGLGLLFGRTFRGMAKSELIILITPTIFYARQNQGNRKAIEKTKKMEDLLKKQAFPFQQTMPENDH